MTRIFIQPLRRAGIRSRPFFCALLLTHCGAPEKPLDLLDAAHIGSWQAAGIPDEGKVVIAAGEITLHAGAPMTGARFYTTTIAEFPTTRYAIDYEAMRVEGSDFFGTLTFPVGAAHLSFVLGGWGGTLVGLSSIDHRDASENETRGDLVFENGRWYRVRIEVREEEIHAWIDQKPFVRVNIAGRRLELRAGFIEKCLPFGFASYLSTARIRGVKITRL